MRESSQVALIVVWSINRNMASVLIHPTSTPGLTGARPWLRQVLRRFPMADRQDAESLLDVGDPGIVRSGQEERHEAKDLAQEK